MCFHMMQTGVAIVIASEQTTIGKQALGATKVFCLSILVH